MSRTLLAKVDLFGRWLIESKKATPKSPAQLGGAPNKILSLLLAALFCLILSF
jgi:hypothetical protein